LTVLVLSVQTERKRRGAVHPVGSKGDKRRLKTGKAMEIPVGVV